MLITLCTAAQYPESHFAEEYEKKSESFYLYPADINKPFLRSIEMINDDQSKKLKRHIKDSLASLTITYKAGLLNYVLIDSTM